MKLIERQAIRSHRRAAAASRAGRVAAIGDEPVRASDALRRGVARIAANDDGDYTITEQWWDPVTGEWNDAASPLGLVNAPARDYSSNAHGAEGQLVRFWQQRAEGGRVATFVDVSAGWDGVQKTSAFCVHYSGTNEITGAFHTVPGCLQSCVRIQLVVAQCSGNGYAEDHPARTALFTSSYQEINVLWALGPSSGGQWQDLDYTGLNSGGGLINTGPSPIAGFYVQARVTGAGDLELRIRNMNDPGYVSAVVMGVIAVVPYGPHPGTLEIGNCCCHEDDCGDWGDGVWGATS